MLAVAGAQRIGHRLDDLGIADIDDTEPDLLGIGGHGGGRGSDA